jgi:hypothetical protein
MQKKELSLQEQLKIAMDGRTQRWLSLEVKIAEAELSKKISGSMPFNQAEIDRINERLSSSIQLPKAAK